LTVVAQPPPAAFKRSSKVEYFYLRLGRNTAEGGCATQNRAYCGKPPGVCKAMAETDLVDAVLKASRRAEALASVDDLYRDVQTEIDRRRPLCVVSGRCCRFDEFGHRLYVTTLELAHFLHHLPPAHARATNPRGCPFQLQKLCTVHSFRPFGCRIFFCDATSTDWQHHMYERFHGDLKRLHETLEVPYYYIEWRQALESLFRTDCA